MDKEHYDRLKEISQMSPWHIRPKLEEFVSEVRPKGYRTEYQNNAIHKFFTMLAQELNEKGKDMRVVLKDDWQIWWTPEAVKDHLWRPVQRSMTGKESTKELEKTSGEIDQIHEMIMKNLGENHGIEWIEFPHNDN